MEKRAFINRIRGLFFIDGDMLPELTSQQQSRFLHDPVRYLLDASEAQSDAIMRQLEELQSASKNTAAPHPLTQANTEAAQEMSKAATAKAIGKKKPKARVDGQREMLLPISGGAGEAPKQAQAPAPSVQNQPRALRTCAKPPSPSSSKPPDLRPASA